MENKTHDYYIRTVKPHGNGARVSVPKRYIGQNVKIVVDEPLRYKRCKISEDERFRLQTDLYEMWELHETVPYRVLEKRANKVADKYNIMSADDLISIVIYSETLDGINGLMSLLFEVI